MEEIFNQLVNVAGNVIFPIVCSYALYKELQAEREDHKAEVKNLGEMIQKNTEVTEKLLERME